MAQVSWYTDLIGKLQRILELGMQTDDLAALAFGQDVFNAVLNLFPAKEALKLGKESEELGRRRKGADGTFHQGVG